MKVILKEKVKGIGEAGTVKEVGKPVGLGPQIADAELGRQGR